MAAENLNDQTISDDKTMPCLDKIENDEGDRRETRGPTADAEGGDADSNFNKDSSFHSSRRPLLTSTPVSSEATRDRCSSNTSSSLGTLTTNSSEQDLPKAVASVTINDSTTESLIAGELVSDFRIPIMGYEILEERSRFAVFKIRVEHQASGESWFVFRRYTDFVRLTKKLRVRFPGLRFSLPPKKWFGGNFDTSFLEDRVLGLQAFINNVVSHKEICNYPDVREFFCLDEPPSPHDSIDESKARCETLEDLVYKLRLALREKETEVDAFRTELAVVRAEQETLLNSLGLRTMNKSRYASLRSVSLGELPSFVQDGNLNASSLYLSVQNQSDESIATANLSRELLKAGSFRDSIDGSKLESIVERSHSGNGIDLAEEAYQESG